MNKSLLFFVFRISIAALSFFPQSLATAQTSILIEENRGQWPSQVLFKADISGSRIFLEKTTITYTMFDRDRLSEIHHDAHHNVDDPDWKEGEQIVNCHTIKVNFRGAREDVNIHGDNPDNAYVNYFIGNDQSKWAGGVPLYKNVSYRSIYNGIDLFFLSNEEGFKYEFLVVPGADPAQISMEYQGSNNLFIEEGNLHISTSINDLIEQKPIAWQVENGNKLFIPCEFKIHNNIVSFYFPEGFNKNLPLIIDPVVVASTYSGSTQDTYGHCATYDDLGNIYAGGRPFSIGYPTTTGAYQVTFGGSVDISITKLNPTGSARIYSTYLGGSSEEFVHSMIVDPVTNQLCIYGSTGSSNFPTTTGAYDQTYNSNTDIIITRFNSAGTALVGSTYIGGSNTDGNNNIYINYGDYFRGEIILDDASNIYVASFSSSNNFPTTAGAYDQSYNGGQDAVVFSLNPNLTALNWSTFLGGSSNDAGFGLRVNANGDVYVVGATGSSGFPATGSAYQSSYQGGPYDGFIACLSNNGSNLQYSTFYGTSSTDEIFFIDLDNSDNVHVYGQSAGSIPISPGKYGNAGSSQFIAKFNPSLSSLSWQTVFGSGSSTGISPTAFLVDVCNHIYASGWGNTFGFPVTPGAIQNSTNGSDFYLIVLDTDATNLLYATFYGSSSWDHVDGGTCRFDKKGIVYEAVCTDAMSFPTTPGAVSPNNNTGGFYDIVVFKIDFQLSGVIADALAAPATGCSPLNVSFTNLSTNGLNYFWDFDDGNTSTQANPTHIFVNPGNYNVMFIAQDPNTCNVADTFYIPVQVTGTVQVNLGPDLVVCPGTPITLDAGNPGATYLWSTSQTTQTITVSNDGLYIVTATAAGCSRTDTIDVQFSPTTAISLGPDTTLCSPFNLQLDAGISGNVYLWSTNDTTQSIYITTPGTYWLQAGPAGCEGFDTIVINSIPAPVVSLGADLVLCDQNTHTLNAPNTGSAFLWSTGATTQSITISASSTVWVEVDNGSCTNRDTVDITFLTSPLVNLGPDTTFCGAFSFSLNAGTPGLDYLWSNNATTQTISVNVPGTYYVTVGPPGCSASDTITINNIAVPVVSLGPDLVLCDQSNYTLNVSNTGSFLWSTGATTQSININNSSTVWVEVNSGGCTNRDTVSITFLTTPVVNLGPDTTLCGSVNFTLDADNQGSDFLWSNNSTSQTIYINSPGTYWVIVGPPGCSSSDTITVQADPQPVVNLGNDIDLCDASDYTLDAGNPGLNYIWSNNATSQSITINSSGLYYVTVIENNCIAMDSINVTFNNSPVFSLGPDITLCGNTPVSLDAGITGNIYQWSTGDTTQNITVQTSGSYSVMVGPSGCNNSDTIEVNLLTIPAPDLGVDTILCDGEVINLSSGYPNYLHQWSDGQTTSSVNVSNPGIYIVTVTNQICTGTDTVEILFEPMPHHVLTEHTPCTGDSVVLDAGNIGFNYLWSTGDSIQTITVSNSGFYWVEIFSNRCSLIDSSVVEYVIITTKNEKMNGCDRMEIVLDAGNPGSNYNWSEGDFSQNLIVHNPGYYWVLIEKNGCTDTSRFEIEIIVGTTNMFLPSAFTPNDDGLNEVFKPVAFGLESYDLKIFNRWGELVFFTEDPQEGWDGTFENEQLKQDIYIYKIEYHTVCNTKEKEEKIGKLMLLR